jgi:hypothetical protein
MRKGHNTLAYIVTHKIDNESLDFNGDHLQYTLGLMYFYQVYNWGAEIALQQMAWEQSDKYTASTLNLLFGKNF